MKTPLLSLDIDGVLNRHVKHGNGYCGIDPECVRWLNHVIEQVPGVEILIHSAWRYMIIGGRMDLKGFEYLLQTHGLDCENRIVGHTGPDSVRPRGAFSRDMDILERAEQIRRWAGDNFHSHSAYVAIDDLPLPLYAEFFVHTDGTVGLTSEKSEEVIRKLRPRL